MGASPSFGPFVLDRERGARLRDGQPVPVGHRAWSVLAALAESGGQPVLKANLIARVWTDGRLTKATALAVRDALGL